MLKPALLSLFCLTLGLSACGDKPSEPTKPADLQSHFSSFTAVTVPGETPQFYLDTNTVKSLNNDLLQFKIVRLVEQGYVIQDAISNCQDSVQTLDGIQYKADGSLDKPFSGDAQPLPYANQSSLAALVKQACDKKTVFSVQPTRIADTESPITQTPTETDSHTSATTDTKLVTEKDSDNKPDLTEKDSNNPPSSTTADAIEQQTSDSNDQPKPETDNLDADVIAGCDAQMQTADTAVECMKGNLQTQKDRLNKAYKIRHDAMSVDEQQALEQTQKAWLDKRNAACGKLSEETSAADAMPMLSCIYKAVKQRADEVEKMPIPKAVSSENKPSQAKDSDHTGTWYKVKAKPNLVVRTEPDITGDKLGLMPQGAKVKVLETGLKKDSINGWDGSWVKIQYQDQEGYVFDAFIEKLK